MHPEESTGPFEHAYGWAQTYVSEAVEQLREAVSRLTEEIGRTTSLLSHGEESVNWLHSPKEGIDADL